MNNSTYLHITQNSLILVDSQQVHQTGPKGSAVSGVYIRGLPLVEVSRALQVRNIFVSNNCWIESGASKPY